MIYSGQFGSREFEKGTKEKRTKVSLKITTTKMKKLSTQECQMNDEAEHLQWLQVGVILDRFGSGVQKIAQPET